jgi:hypothetical protein
MSLRQLCGIYAAVACLCAIFISGVAEAGLDWLKVTPELLDSQETDVTAGLKFDFNADNRTLVRNDTLTLDYVLKGEWASEGDANTDPIEAKVQMSFDKLTFYTEGDIYYFAQLNAGYATDDRLDEQEFAGGATAAVSYQKSPMFKLDMLAHYSWVYSMESDRREALGGDDTDNFGRLELEALAVMRLREVIKANFFRNLKVSGNYRYFNQHGLDDAVDAAGEDSFDYIRIDLAYEWWPSLWDIVQEVFVSYAYGHLPTQVDDQSVWTVGVVLYGAENF